MSLFPYFSLTLADGDRLLLCSDGLNEMVDDATIGQILGRHDDPQEAAQDLLGEALGRGGKDNITVIVACYQVTGRRTAGRDSTDAGNDGKFDSTTDSFVPPGPIGG